MCCRLHLKSGILWKHAYGWLYSCYGYGTVIIQGQLTTTLGTFRGRFIKSLWSYLSHGTNFHHITTLFNIFGQIVQCFDVEVCKIMCHIDRATQGQGLVSKSADPPPVNNDCPLRLVCNSLLRTMYIHENRHIVILFHQTGPCFQ